MHPRTLPARHGLFLAALLILTASPGCTLPSSAPPPEPEPSFAPPQPVAATRSPAGPVASPVPTLQPSPTGQTSPATTPTETPIGPEQVFTYIYQEGFSAPPANWDLDEFEAEVARLQFSLEENAYLWQVEAMEAMTWIQLSDPAVLLPEGDFLLTVNLDLGTSGEAVAAGLLFNCQDRDNLYFAWLSGSGQVATYALVANAWQELVTPVLSADYLPGQTNRLSVVRAGARTEIRVNDYPAGSFTDTRFRGGSLGLAVNMEAGSSTALRFDDLRLMQPGSASRVDATRPTMLPMGAARIRYEGRSGGLVYSLEYPYPFFHTTAGDRQQFCLDAPEPVCVSIQAVEAFPVDSTALAEEALAGLNETVDHYLELHRQSIQTAQGYPVEWVGYAYSSQGQERIASRRFVVVDGVGFDLLAEAEPGMMALYRPLLNTILESFRVLP